MTLSLDDCTFHGHALTESFAKGDLEGHLAQAKLLGKTSGPEGKALVESWEVYRRKLRALGQGQRARVASHVLEPLVSRLGYAALRRDGEVHTREGDEDAGWVFESTDGKARLRAWAVDMEADLDAPTERGKAYRYSPGQIAQRVLQAKDERIALLTDGSELRVILRDPGRRESFIAIHLDQAGGWRASRKVPDSYRLLLALGQPAGVAKVGDLVEQARLAQARVTVTLRDQAKQAVQQFVQAVLDDARNAAFFGRYPDKGELAQKLYRDALILVYRLLFILKLESSSDPAQGFSFASTSLWRNTYSPARALSPVAKKALDEGAETGQMLSGGLRALFRMFQEGFRWSEMRVNKLGGMLFGPDAAPLLDDAALCWSELATAKLLDNLLRTPRGQGGERQFVHYGQLEVEDLGRVYEALLELEPGIATEAMCRLRRQKLEVVVPTAQGERYRANAVSEVDAGDEEPAEEDEEDKPAKGKTRVVWVEEIPAGRFYLRVGLGRKATGSYYTPHAFVRFLVQETLGPQVAERSPKEDPQPLEILKLKVLDPAMGSGHFLVEACRFLGEALYEACRTCDVRAREAEERAEKALGAEREALLGEAGKWRGRVVDLPDPNDEMLAYLPSRAKEGEESGVSAAKAKALAKRLVAVHCLYGVDKNPLAVELAKLALWLESYAEGLPLTFLDHRLIVGDSLTGPFFEKLGTYPRSGEDMRGDLFARKLVPALTGALAGALGHVRDLEATVGKDEADIQHKRAAKERLDGALAPFKKLAAAWAGGVMLGGASDDDAYATLTRAVAEQQDLAATVSGRSGLQMMIDTGEASISYDLTFPEVFFPSGKIDHQGGFHAVIGNPPWDAIKFNTKEFLASFDIRILDAPTKRERDIIEKQLLKEPQVDTLFQHYQEQVEEQKRANDKLYDYQKVTIHGDLAGRQLDAFRVFMERKAQMARPNGQVGAVVPSAFHANAGAAGIRRLYFEEMTTRSCFSFENAKKLFEIHSSFKFATVVAARKHNEAQQRILCTFYRHNLEWLFRQDETLTYSVDFIRRTGGEYLSLLELRSQEDLDIAENCFLVGAHFATVATSAQIRLGSEIHMTNDAGRFVPNTINHVRSSGPHDLQHRQYATESDHLVLHEGKTFHQYTDRWDAPPRYLVALAQLHDKPGWLKAAQHFRLAFRDIARSTDERTGIFCMVPPGVLFGNTAPCEREPQNRPASAALQLLACTNSYPFDWTLRQKSAAHVNLFILDGCPVPPSAFEHPRAAFLAHSALRLTCNHEGYAPLWQEQLADTWREPTPKHTWPVLAGDDARWTVRAAIDAVVAQAYGLTRDQYAHILGTFSHKSYPKAPALCLAAFDDLQRVGLDAFVKANDPYWDIPLVESLPQPVIHLLPTAQGPAASTAPGASPAAPAPLIDRTGQLSMLADGGPMFGIVPVPVPAPVPAPAPPPLPAPPADDPYPTLARLLEERGLITSRDAQTATALDAAAVRPLLKRLVDEGKAAVEGEKRGTKYRWVGGRS